MAKEPLPKVDVDIKGEEIKNVIASAGDDGITAIDIGKELSLLSDDMDPLKSRAVTQKIRSAARRVCKANNWVVAKKDKKAFYTSQVGVVDQAEAKAEKSSAAAVEAE